MKANPKQRQEKRLRNQLSPLTVSFWLAAGLSIFICCLSLILSHFLQQIFPECLLGAYPLRGNIPMKTTKSAYLWRAPWHQWSVLGPQQMRVSVSSLIKGQSAIPLLSSSVNPKSYQGGKDVGRRRLWAQAPGTGCKTRSWLEVNMGTTVSGVRQSPQQKSRSEAVWGKPLWSCFWTWYFSKYVQKWSREKNLLLSGGGGTLGRSQALVCFQKA